MARMPGARWLGEHSPRTRMSRYDAVCVHTIVGYAPAHAAHFSVKRDGTILQSRDTAYRSAANLNGNHRVISIENEDAGRWWEPLTPAQVESNAQILAWAHKVHGVRLKLCPNSRRWSKGLAYHRQGIDGNFGTPQNRYPGRVLGGELWSQHRGKVCPGDAKIAQRPKILARAKQIVDPNKEEGSVRLTKKNKQWFRNEIRKAVRDAAAEAPVNVHPDADNKFDDVHIGRALKFLMNQAGFKGK